MKPATLFDEFANNIVLRWRPNWSSHECVSPLKNVIAGALGATIALRNRMNEMRKAARYSPSGLISECRTLAQKETVPALKRSQQIIADTKARVAQDRAKMTLPKGKAEDAAAAVLRSDLRAWLKTMPRAQAVAMLMAGDVDEQLLIAAIEVPAAMMGPLGDARPQIEAHILSKRHGAAIAALEEQEEAIELAHSAVGVCLYQLGQEAGFRSPDDAAFKHWFSGPNG